MRIVAGQWRGRTLVAPAGSATRPTADRVRQALRARGALTRTVLQRGDLGRREFLGAAGASLLTLAGPFARGWGGSRRIQRIGLQLYTVRDAMRRRRICGALLFFCWPNRCAARLFSLPTHQKNTAAHAAYVIENHRRCGGDESMLPATSNAIPGMNGPKYQRQILRSKSRCRSSSRR